jgi:hypothetical protein
LEPVRKANPALERGPETSLTLRGKGGQVELTPIQKNLIILTAAYPRAEFPNETIALYTEKLGKVPPKELYIAIHAWIDRERYMPTVADLFREWRLTRPERLAIAKNSISMVPASEEEKRERRKFIEQNKRMMADKGFPGIPGREER